jgi:hypothetical protein
VATNRPNADRKTRAVPAINASRATHPTVVHLIHRSAPRSPGAPKSQLTYDGGHVRKGATRSPDTNHLPT